VSYVGRESLESPGEVESGEVESDDVELGETDFKFRFTPLRNGLRKLFQEKN